MYDQQWHYVTEFSRHKRERKQTANQFQCAQNMTKTCLKREPARHVQLLRVRYKSTPGRQTESNTVYRVQLITCVSIHTLLFSI